MEILKGSKKNTRNILHRLVLLGNRRLKLTVELLEVLDKIIIRILCGTANKLMTLKYLNLLLVSLGEVALIVELLSNAFHVLANIREEVTEGFVVATGELAFNGLGDLGVEGLIGGNLCKDCEGTVELGLDIFVFNYVKLYYQK